MPLTKDPELLTRIGTRVRSQRTQAGHTIKELSERSGLSPRFLSEVEAGRANISVGRLASLAGALGVSLTMLLRPPAGNIRQAIDGLLAECSPSELPRVLNAIEITLGRRTPRIIGVLGVRGAGKSTVGPLLAKALQLPFVELVTCIEAGAGMPVGDIFTLHGEPHYRAFEARCLSEAIETGDPCVLALPGGVVENEPAFSLIRHHVTTIWLQATAADYWSRVFAQGDTRPMAGRDNAMADLESLIARRKPLYQTANVVVNTSNQDPEAVVGDILTKLDTARLRPWRFEEQTEGSDGDS